MDGLLLVDKPAGVTSFDVVRRLRKLARTSKVGHTGTLDPDATGLLGVVFGKCTKLANFLVLEHKEYHFEMKFGQATDTDDASGSVIETCAWEHVERAALLTVLEQFHGTIQQVPPIYSALKVDGKRAYDLARRGEHVELAARPVEIRRLWLEKFDLPLADLGVECGSGTYVRSLCRDIARELDSCAHTIAIRRTAVGSFRIEEAHKLDEITEDNIAAWMRSPMDMLSALSVYHASLHECSKLAQGQRIRVEQRFEENELVAVAFNETDLVAVAEVETLYPDGSACLKPKKVLKSPDDF